MKSTLKVIAVALLIQSLSSCGLLCKMENNGENTIYKEFSPEALLQKYEWFKEASAQLDAKIATLGTYESRFKEMKHDYGRDSTTRTKWSRDDREQYSIWQSEYTGIKASYNDLAAQYNADMVKFNYRFCNVGDLPKGATVPLPREYKAYINQ